MASDPITSWQIDGENMETGTDFIFLGSNITADSDCSHEIKRHLLLGRKAIYNKPRQCIGKWRPLFQHHSSKASIFWCLAFLMVQLSYPYVTTEKTIALTIWTFVSKATSLLFNTLSRFVIAFLPRSKHLLISWLQSPSAVILKLKKIVCHRFHCFSVYLP